jgi:hypothetical protein
LNEKLKQSGEKGQKHECNTHSTDRVDKVNLNAEGAVDFIGQQAYARVLAHREAHRLIRLILEPSRLKLYISPC